MKKALLLVFILLLLSNPTSAAPKDDLTEAYKEWFEARQAVLLNWEALTTTTDSFNFQRWDTSLSDALITIDSWKVDKCWLPWYAVARTEFELQVEVSSLSKTPRTQEEYATLNSMLSTAFNMKHLNEVLFNQAVKECSDGTTG